VKRILKIVGIATVLSALLVVSIGGVVSAANNGPRAGDEAPYGDGDCICDCTCDCLGDGECFRYGDCTCGENAPNLWGETEQPGPHGVGAAYSYNGDGPNGVKNCKGRE